jgi:hypothetical protein
MKNLLTEATAFAMGLVPKVVSMLPKVASAFSRIGALFPALFGPVGTVLATFVGTLLGPLVKYVALAVAFVALLFAVMIYGDVHGRHRQQAIDTKAFQEIIKENKQETADAVAHALAARAAADKKFDAGRFDAHPRGVVGRVHHGSDGFARD